MFLRTRLLAAIFLCFFCIRLQAQSAPVPSSSFQQKKVSEPAAAAATTLKVTTRLVVLDVVATDKRGQAVTDLKPQDFTVVEDSKRQEIRMFSFHRPQATGAEPVKAPKLPANVFTNIPTYNPNNSLNVILLDLINTDFNDQAYGRQRILKYLESIPEGEPMTIAVYTLGKKLRLIQDFTSDFATLRSAIHGLKNERPVLLENAAAGVSPDVKDLVPNLADQQIEKLAEAFEGGQQLDRRVEYTLEALFSLARNLSGYPGRKNLIWISTAFPIGFGPNANLGPYEFDNLHTYEQSIISASQALGDAQIAVYPVDPRGPLSPSIYGGHGTVPDDQVVTLSREADSEVSEQSTMKQVAQLTGGKAYLQQNDIEDAIRNSIVDGSTYYTLAYYPGNKDWHGEFRKISITIGRPGVKLRHRPGYYALNTRGARDSKQMFIAFGLALRPDSPISTGLRFEAGVIQPLEKTDNKVLLNFALDPHTVSFEKQNDGLQHAAVNYAVQAYSESGQLIKTDANTVSVALDEQTFAKAMKTYLLAHVSIALPAGSYRLRLGVMDDYTGVIGTTNARVSVTSTATATEKKTEEKKP